MQSTGRTGVVGVNMDGFSLPPAWMNKLPTNRHPRRKIGNNTYLEWINQGMELGLLYHRTYVAMFTGDGKIILHTGGWLTVTTKERINLAIAHTGLTLYSDRSLWQLGAHPWSGDDRSVPFEEGMIVTADGVCYHSTGMLMVPEDKKAVRRQHTILRKKVKVYCDAFIDKMRRGEIPAPGPGDCFFCYLTGQDGATWGDGSRRKFGEDLHMLGHLDASYYVPSLLARAVDTFANESHYKNLLAVFWDPSATDDETAEEYRACSHPEVENHAHNWCGDSPWRVIHRALYRYVKREVGLA